METAPIIYRASELGGCSKALVAKRLGYVEVAVGAGFQQIFKEGELHEGEVVQRLKDQGSNIFDQQLELNLTISNGIIVQGHIDGKIEDDTYPGTRVLEIKSMSPDAYKQFLNKRWDTGGLIDKYKWQISVYMIATGYEALVVFKNRSTGAIHYEGIEVPFYDFAAIRGRVLGIEDQVATGIVHAECDFNNYPCPFYYLHEETSIDGAASSSTSNNDNEAIHIAAVQYFNDKRIADEAAKQTKSSREHLLKLLGTTKSITVGNFKISQYDVNNPTRYDVDSMRNDGIDVTKYELRTRSKRLRVTEQGDYIGRQDAGGNTRGSETT